MLSTPAAVSSSQNFTLPIIAELYDPNFLDSLLPPGPNGGKAVRIANPVPLKTNPMMDALQGTAHHTLTENNAPTFNSTLSSALDAFQGLSHAYGDKVNHYLTKAWEEDPDLTLRIIWGLRSIHDGKGEKEAFYRAFGWLYDNHPRTAITNLHLLVSPVCISPKKGKLPLAHGYWKDLLNILALATLDQLSSINGQAEFLHHPRMPFTYRKKVKKEGDPAQNIEAARQAAMREKAEAKKARIDAAVQAHDRLVAKLTQPKFRALYIAVARLFSERLIEDLRILQEITDLPANADRIPLLRQISLAAKWAPTPHRSHDRHTNISTAISMLIRQSQTSIPFPSALNTPLEPRMTTAILRSFYQRWILTPLRKIALVPEPLMSANRWTEINYSRVSSLCMKNNTEHFYTHDPEGFEKYLISVESGKKQISGATLLPHELVAQAGVLGRQAAYQPNESTKLPALKEFKKKLAETQLRVVEAQWKTLIERLRESGSIENAIAICDVSGSMGSLSDKYDKKDVQPILPAVSLSLVLAQLAKPPFNNGFITFSSRPEFVSLDPTKSLADTVNSMVDNPNWEMNTDLNAVFLDLILPLAIKNQVKQEDMIKRLFVFSDMQFDEGGGTSARPDEWTTNHDVIEKAYQAAGYEMPQIVYWDLANYGTSPVTAERKGVALMNGFSPSMLKAFMGDSEEVSEWEKVDGDGDSETVVEKEEFNPVSVMKKALLRKSFEGLVVID